MIWRLCDSALNPRPIKGERTKSLGLERWGSSRDSRYGVIPWGKKPESKKGRKEKGNYRCRHVYITTFTCLRKHSDSPESSLIMVTQEHKALGWGEVETGFEKEKCACHPSTGFILYREHRTLG